MSLPLVIVNPKSAAGETRAAWAGIASDLRRHCGAFEVAFTERAGHAQELAHDAARGGRELIVACGGDGTLNEVANGILTSGAKDAGLAVLPSGTGGDFRRSLEIPNDAKRAAQIIRDGKTALIDVGLARFTGHDGKETGRYFLGVASFGLSAEVIARAKDEKSSWLPPVAKDILGGRAAYAAAMVQTSVQVARPLVAITFEDAADALHLKVTNLCVANGRYFGGGMKIAPDAKLNDGVFDIVAIGDLSTAQILVNAPKLYFGRHLGMQEVGHARAVKLAAKAVNENETIGLEIDGELPGHLPAVFEVLPRALKIRVPR